MDTPKTLQDAIVFFSNLDNCVAYMAAARWPNGVVECPTCGRLGASWLANQKKWQCKTKHAKRQFSAKVGTVFEDSPIALDKWLMASWMLANCKNGVSSYEISRAVGVTQKSAWFMMHRIRLAMKDTNYGSKLGTPGPLGNAAAGVAHAAKDDWEHGPQAVEVDESFLGGKLSNMHKSRAEKLKAEAVKSDVYEERKDHKTAVIGMLDRSTRQVRAKVVKNVKRETLQAEILKNVKYGSAIYTDEAVVHDTLRQKFVHETVNHSETYVNGQVHTNSLENFWSLLKRNLAGTYVAVEPFHLDRYLDEQVFRFNNRLGKHDGQRLDTVMRRIVGKRLTYADLTGKTEAAARRGATGAGEAF